MSFFGRKQKTERSATPPKGQENYVAEGGDVIASGPPPEETDSSDDATTETFPNLPAA